MPSLSEAATESNNTTSTGARIALNNAPGICSGELVGDLPRGHPLTDHRARAAGSGTIGYISQLVRVAIPLMASDLISVVFSICAAYSIVFWFGKPINHFQPFLTACIVAFAVIFWVVGCYSVVGVAPAKELRKTIRGCVAAGIVISIGLLVINNLDDPNSTGPLSDQGLDAGQSDMHPILLRW